MPCRPVQFLALRGLPRGVVLLDAGYGNHTSMRTQIGVLELSYAAGILSNSSVWEHHLKRR